MKKILFTLAVDGYSTDITDITFPLMRSWARKIGAEFVVIDDRRFPEWPAAVEKLQIHARARELGADWAVYLDADALVHPDMFDVTEHLSRDTVLYHMLDMASTRFVYDEYFRRDGRHHGAGNWLAVASSWCLDLWHPPVDLTPQAVAERIFPTAHEVSHRVSRAHLSDDFLLSRNIARFGLKVDTVVQMSARLNVPPLYFFHQYTLTLEQKIAALTGQMQEWQLA